MDKILSKLPEVVRPAIKKSIPKAFTAKSHEQGMAMTRSIITENIARLPTSSYKPSPPCCKFSWHFSIFPIGYDMMGQMDPIESSLLGITHTLSEELHPGQTGVIQFTLDSSLDRDFGLDSLSRVELASRIEKTFGVALSEHAVAEAETPRDFLRAIIAGIAAPAIAKEKTLPSKPSPEIPSDIPSVSIPASARTLLDVLEWHVSRQPDATHIRFYNDASEGEALTFRNLRDRAGSVAAGLLLLGLAPGESVLIMLPTGEDYFVSFFGILLAGGVPVPMYPPGRIKQIGEHLERHSAIAANSRARVLITLPEAAPFAHLMQARAPEVRHVVTREGLAGLARGAPPFSPAHTKEGDTAFIQYTSGSTGSPKGVVLSHANLLANVRAMGAAVRVTPEDVFVSWLPLYHDMGLIGAWLGSLYHGCPLVIMPPLSFLSRPARWLKAIHRHRGTLSAGPNFAYDLCVRKIEDAEIAGIDLSSWRAAFNGAEAVRPATVRRFTERFTKYGFHPAALMPVYGLAENSVGLAFPPVGRGMVTDRILRRALMDEGRAVAAEPSQTEQDILEFPSCGIPIPGHEVRIVDDAGRELPDRQEGRLEFRGPSSTSGYFRNPEATRSLFRHEGWLDSGDRAYLADGELYITGRIKDIVIRAGRNIHPEEIEEAVGRIDGVWSGNVAVFGSLAPGAGTERLIVLAETRKKTPEEISALTARINETVTAILGEPPDEIVPAPPNTIPRTSSGKIRRDSCRRIFEAGAVGKPPPPVWRQVAGFALGRLRMKVRVFFREALSLAYAVWAWGLSLLAVTIAGISVLFLPSMRLRWSAIRILIRALSSALRIPARVEGREKLTSSGQTVVFVSNHASYIDSLVLCLAIPRPACFVAKAELMEVPVLGLLLRHLGVLAVERFDRKQSIEDARRITDAVRNGASLIFFPEGTFTRMPGLLPFRMGAFETAVQGGFPVLPLVIRGTRSILRSGSWLPRRGPIRVIVGHPVPVPEPEEGGDPWKRAVSLKSTVRGWMLRHLGEPDLDHETPSLLSGSRRTGEAQNR